MSAAFKLSDVRKVADWFVEAAGHRNASAVEVRYVGAGAVAVRFDLFGRDRYDTYGNYDYTGMLRDVREMGVTGYRPSTEQRGVDSVAVTLTFQHPEPDALADMQVRSFVTDWNAAHGRTVVLDLPDMALAA